ncbi:hypothetical protein [Parafrankia colletiae]|nr:hypothetical protein [Parafrankia colletiae]
MPTPLSRRAWPLLAAIVAVLGLVGAPGALPRGHGQLAPQQWSADLTPAAWSATVSRRTATVAEPVNAAAPKRGNALRPWLDAQPLLATSHHQRSEHQLLGLGAALCILVLSAAWLAARPGTAERTPHRAGGGPGSRGPPAASSR